MRGNKVFYIVDVFAENKYEGNQLAVIRNAADIPGEIMQRIAREMHFSETTFILSEEERDGGYDVRIFTPEEELPFAGHPTLGTAFIIQQEIIRKNIETVTLNLGVGRIPVTFQYKNADVDTLWMHQKPPAFGQIFDSEMLAKIIGIDPGLIDDRVPIQAVSTGVPAIIVPLKTLDAVKKAEINRELYFDFVSKIEPKGILIFAPETYAAENHLNVRFFADYFGVPEDPATGSANGCLAGYLVKHRYFGKEKIDIRVEQGYEIRRPSLLYLRAAQGAEDIDVRVGGRVIPIARGTLL